MRSKIYLVIIFVIAHIPAYTQSIQEEKPKKEFYYSAHISHAPSNDSGVSINGGLLVNSGYDRTVTLDLKGFANYDLIRNYLSFGAGTVLSRTYTPNFNQFWLMGQLKGYLSDEINTIYLYIEIGKSIPIGDIFLNGQGAGIGIGFRFEAFDNIFMVDVSSFNRSVQFDGLRYRDSQHKALVTGAYFGIGFQF